MRIGRICSERPTDLPRYFLRIRSKGTLHLVSPLKCRLSLGGNMETLSQHLCDIVSQMDVDFMSDAAADEKDEAAEWVASKMTAYLLESLEAFKQSERVTAVEVLYGTRNKTMMRFLESRFDECYTRQLLERIPKM